jgi:hypothetical protein
VTGQEPHFTAIELLAALDLPGNSRVDRRVPKKLLLENSSPTAADKRYIKEGVEELWWVAALKPTTIAVPAYQDEIREYLEIAILRLTLRSGAKISRLVELVHRAVPYPVLLFVEEGELTGISAIHKRWSQSEAGKTVLDEDMVAVEWEVVPVGSYLLAFRDALSLGRQPQATLYTLYQGWIDTLLALRAAELTGTFSVPDSTERARERRAALQDCERLDAEIASLRAAAEKEKQVPRLVELNLEIKRLVAALVVARSML